MRRNQGQAEKRCERVHRLFRKRKRGGLGGQQGRIRGEIRLSQREEEMGEEALAERTEEAKQRKLALRNLVFKTLTKLSFNSYMYDSYTLKKYLLIVVTADVYTGRPNRSSRDTMYMQNEELCCPISFFVLPIL